MMTVTHVVYQYNPISLFALEQLLRYEMYGEEMVARRYICEMLKIIASDKRLDDSLENASYYDRIANLYKNPYSKESTETGEDIVKALLKG